MPSRHRMLDGILNRGKPGFYISLQIHPQDAPVTFGKDVEVPARLCGFDDAEACAMSWDRQIPGIVGGNLEKHAAIGTALVSLACRMQETRTKAEAGCGVSPVPHGEPQ